MQIALDYRYFLSLINLGCKEEFWTKDDFHPLIQPYIRHYPKLEKDLLILCLLYDNVSFCLPYEFAFDRPGFVTIDDTIPFRLITSKTGFSLSTTTYYINVTECFGILHERLFGNNPTPFGELESSKNYPLNLINTFTLCPEVPISITSDLYFGPRNLSSNIIYRMIDIIQNDDKNAFSKLVNDSKNLINKLKIEKEISISNKYKAFKKNWDHLVFTNNFRKERIKGILDGDDFYGLIDTDLIKTTPDGTILLEYLSYIISSTSIFEQLFELSDSHAAFFEKDYDLGLSIKPPQKKKIPQTSALRVYKIALDKFLEEDIFLPQPNSLKEVLKLRDNQNIKNFREVFSLWKEVFKKGERKLFERVKKDTLIALSAMRRIENTQRLCSIITITALPIWIIESLLSFPVVGPVLTSVGFISESFSKIEKTRNKWIQLLK